VDILDKKETHQEEILKVAKKTFFAPEGDKRLTINMRVDLYRKLKTAAAEKNTTSGEIIEQLIEKYL
jgi:hypothetical protein